MSFKFNWRFFDLEDLEARCQKSMTESIATVSRPPVIVKPMQVTAIEFGTVPPELAFHSIPSVSLKRVHMVFALRYRGDASLTLETSIEANPLREPYFDPELPAFAQPKIIAATDSLVLPFRLKLKDIVLDTLVDVVYTPSGTLVNFHDDPVKHVGADSTLDMIPGVKALLGGILTQSITASFYEDVPEAVWTSSNPAKQAPDPWFGARRWSQHNQRFTRFNSFLVNSLGPRSKIFRAKFATLALNVDTPELRLPGAILSRTCLASLDENYRDPARQQALSPTGITDLFAASSDTESVRSSLATASSTAASDWSRHKRPKRRVISLRHLRATKETPETSPNPTPNATPTPNGTPAGPKLPSRGPSNPLFTENSAANSAAHSAATSAAHSAANSSNGSPRHLGKPRFESRAEPLTPPVFAADDALADLDDVDVNDTVLLDYPRLVPPDSAFQRRLSMPDERRLGPRRSGQPSKHRTVSMLAPETPSSPTLLPAMPGAPPRSPRSRYVSTNDLMNK